MELTLNALIGLAVLGVVVGVISGMLGIGGGIIVIPTLVLVFGFDQKMANGTSLAMLFPPAGVPALVRYFQSGNIHLLAAIILAVGFLVGAYGGAAIANAEWMRSATLREIFAFFVLFMGTLMLLRADLTARAVLLSLVLLIGYVIAFYGLRLLGRRWAKQFHLEETYRRALHYPAEPDYHI